MGRSWLRLSGSALALAGCAEVGRQSADGGTLMVNREEPSRSAPALAHDRPASPSRTGETIVVGQIVRGGVECPLLRIDGGGSATLQGGRAPAPGARVRVTGRWIERSTCQQGPAIQAEIIEQLKD